jgi:hypothetical protein
MVDIFRCVKRKDYLRLTYDPASPPTPNPTNEIFDQRKLFEFDANLNNMNFDDLKDLILKKFALNPNNQTLGPIEIYLYSSDKDIYTIVDQGKVEDKGSCIWGSDKLAFGDGYWVEFAGEGEGVGGEEEEGDRDGGGGEVGEGEGDRDGVEMPGGF